MPWQIPQPAAISARAAATYSTVFQDFDPTEPNTVAGTHCDVLAMALFDVYLHQSYIAGELFPDTSIDNLDRHAGIWGLTRIPATAASGTVSVGGAGGLVVPSGIAATDVLGNLYATTSGATIVGGSATLSITAASAGAQGNLAAGTVLTLLSPIAGLNPQSLTVQTPGLSGGAAQESDAALRSRLLARIRARGRGGNAADYQYWAEAASSAVEYVQVYPNWAGLGSVQVWVAGAGPSALTTSEVSAIAAYIAGVRPVTASVTVASAAVEAVNATVHLVPDTVANRTAATTGFSTWLAASAQIGGTLYVDDMIAAIKAAGGGAFSLDTSAPTGDIVLGAGTIGVAGTLSFT
jgi:uncharacterized phage protein gp47/JayE